MRFEDIANVGHANHDALQKSRREHAEQNPQVCASAGQRLFFTCWTRKEAFIKATGDGLSRPLDSFVVTFLPQDPPAVFQAQDAQSPIEGWTLIPLEPGPDYVAALVVAAIGSEVNLKVFVTHFGNFVSYFDRILTLEKGRLVEDGTHDDSLRGLGRRACRREGVLQPAGQRSHAGKGQSAA